MTAAQILEELKSLGSEQTRKISRRHGVQEPLYGVSCASLGKIRKRIKVDHELALELWASGNHDARVLATFIADPEKANVKMLTAWSRDLDCYPLTDSFVELVSRTSVAPRLMEKWTHSRQEWLGSAGWHLLSYLSRVDSELTDAYLEDRIETIEEEIHARKNRVRHSMNGALISIGIRTPPLQKKALAAAGRIGKVEVDHGHTGCKTPDAADYIRKTVAHRKTMRR